MLELEGLIAAHPPAELCRAPALGGMALIAAALGDRARAEAYYPQLAIFEGQHHWFLVDRALGVLATLLGDWPAAERYLEAALATAEREGIVPELARVRRARGELEAARGRSRA
jgi:hypothetical protein